MDTKLQILTSSEHVFLPLHSASPYPTSLCVVYSVGGVASISAPLKDFHLAYLPLSAIHARPIAAAPTNTKLMLRAKDGIWAIGSFQEHSRKLYQEWAPLPKLPAEMKAIATRRECATV